MKKLTLVFLLTTSLLMTTAGLAVASEPAQIIRFPVTGFALLNPCAGEVVEIVRGTFQIVLHETVDASGGIHLIAEGNAQGVEGVSASGRYRVTGGFWAEYNKNGSNAQEVFTETVVFNVISQSSTDNFTFEGVVHFTINANGEVTTAFAKTADGVCRG